MSFQELCAVSESNYRWTTSSQAIVIVKRVTIEFDDGISNRSTGIWHQFYNGSFYTHLLPRNRRPGPGPESARVGHEKGQFDPPLTALLPDGPNIARSN